MAAVAYVDPGNFATNIEGGSSYGYSLLWVVIAAGLVAMPVQFLSAKLGIVTGRSLPEACRERYRPRTTRALWLQAEVMAMATDIAEFMGTAVALDLLFGIPLPAAVCLTGALSYLMLGVQARRHPFEMAIAAMLCLMCAGFGYLMLRSGVDGGALVSGLVPGAADQRRRCWRWASWAPRSCRTPSICTRRWCGTAMWPATSGRSSGRCAPSGWMCWWR